MFGLDDHRLHGLAADHLARLLPHLDDAGASAETETLVRILRRSRLGARVDMAASAAALDAARDGLMATVAQLNEAVAGTPEERAGTPDEKALTAHLRERFADQAVAAADVVTVAGGFSKQTILFDKVDGHGGVERLVLRRDFPDSPVETTVRDEFPVLCDLAAAGIAVPEPMWLDGGSDHVPGPFLVSRRVDGQPLGDPAGGASAGLTFDPTELLATTLAQLHAIPLHAMQRSRLCDRSWDLDALGAQLDYWERRYRDHADGSLPVLDAGFRWLRENATLGIQAPVVVHGDFGFHNMLVSEGRFVALVDWELVHVGSPAWDLAYVRNHMSRLGSYDRFLAAYVAAGGTAPPAGALDYFHVFSLLRTITMTIVVLASFNRGVLNRIPLIDVAQLIYPLQTAALADQLARVQAPATVAG